MQHRICVHLIEFAALHALALINEVRGNDREALELYQRASELGIAAAIGKIGNSDALPLQIRIFELLISI